MAIKFLNIRSKEVVVAETEPQIAALWGSSDKSPNVSQGQDFGWRLAPAIVVEMDRIKGDEMTLERIARKLKKEVEEINEIDILYWISGQNEPVAPQLERGEDYSDEYQAEIRRLKRQENGQATAPALNLAEVGDEFEGVAGESYASKGANTATTTTTTVAPASNKDKK